MNPTPPAHPIPVVRLVIEDAQGRVLILKRAPDSAGGGRWCLPGGKIDHGQSVEEAVREELLDETGLRLLEHRLLFYDDGVSPPPGKPHYLNLYFICRTEGEVALNRESTDFAWMACAEIERYVLAFNHDRAMLRFWFDAGR
jgi:ADP-ribose pyrophosphatase YjhB (NUDIX family)